LSSEYNKAFIDKAPNPAGFPMRGTVESHPADALPYVENTGSTDLKFLEMFKSSVYQDLALSEWLAHTPPELVRAHLGIDKATLDALPQGRSRSNAEIAR
jgi:hypothetical protein